MDRVAQVMMDDVIEAVEQKTIEANLIPWITHVGQNLRSGKGRYIGELKLPEDRKKETLFIVGPGPSIYQYRDKLPLLRELGTVVAQPSSYQWMRKIGLEPDLIVAVDHMKDQPDSIAGSTCPVLAPTIVNPQIGGFNAHWFTLYMGDGKKSHPKWGHWNFLMYHLHHATIGAHGWISLGDVTNMATQIFVHVIDGTAPFECWNLKRIVYVGIDRCYWNGYERVMAFIPTRTASPGDDMPPLPPDKTDIDYRGQCSRVNMIMYVMMLYKFWHMYPKIPLYRLDHGIMREIPFVTLAQILAGKYPKPLSEATVKKRMEKWLREEWLKMVPYGFGAKEDIDEMMRLSALKLEAMEEEGARAEAGE